MMKCISTLSPTLRLRATITVEWIFWREPAKYDIYKRILPYTIVAKLIEKYLWYLQIFFLPRYEGISSGKPFITHNFFCKKELKKILPAAFLCRSFHLKHLFQSMNSHECKICGIFASEFCLQFLFFKVNHDNTLQFYSLFFIFFGGYVSCWKFNIKFV